MGPAGTQAGYRANGQSTREADRIEEQQARCRTSGKDKGEEIQEKKEGYRASRQDTRERELRSFLILPAHCRRDLEKNIVCVATDAFLLFFRCLFHCLSSALLRRPLLYYFIAGLFRLKTFSSLNSLTYIKQRLSVIPFFI